MGAHEIGHLIGMDHDFEENRNFNCDKQKYLMGYYGKIHEDKGWSDCSNQDFKSFFEEQTQEKSDFCLKDSPDDAKAQIRYGEESEEQRERRCPSIVSSKNLPTTKTATSSTVIKITSTSLASSENLETKQQTKASSDNSESGNNAAISMSPATIFFLCMSCMYMFFITLAYPFAYIFD